MLTQDLHFSKDDLAQFVFFCSLAYSCGRELIKLTRYTLMFWLALYLVEQLNYTVAEAGYRSASYEILGFVGVLMAGYASDRFARGRRFPVGAAILLGLAIACWLLPQLSALGRAGNLMAVGLVSIFTYGPDTLMGGAATQDAARLEKAATAAGFINGVGSIGQLLSPLLVASVVGWAGWDGLFTMFSAVALLGGVGLANA